MSPQIKSLIRRLLSQSAIERLRFVLTDLPRSFEHRAVQRVFQAAADAPAYLDPAELPRLQARYPSPPEYGYDPGALERRGVERAAQLLRLPGARAATAFLELGCWDGMVALALQRKGKTATAIDGRSDGFDERAVVGGVQLVQMDAAAMSFVDDAFDFVYSYDAFEHFASPESVLREAIRVAKPGGHIYLEFGPLYYSAFGEHAYRSVTVPYCQVLFPKQVLSDFTFANRLPPIDFGDVNGWSLDRYRDLWKKHSAQLALVQYHETRNLAHLDLIRDHPTCFKSKSRTFEDFLVSGISVQFRKR